MKLTDDLPKWLAWPLRLVLYAFVMFILVNVAASIIRARALGNAEECSYLVSTAGGGLKHAKSMVACIRGKNGILENWMMGSLYRAIDAMPNAPKEFVGTWHASQPRCNYRHKLSENGEFISEPIGCSISGETFHGTWGVYDNQMIWLADEGVMWPPDINPMDVVDRDFFLLVERDGTRTRFTRVAGEGSNNDTGKIVQAIPDAAVAKGYDWAKTSGVRSHAACRQRWTEANHESLERSGCSKYVTEVNVLNVIKPIPKHNGWDDGTTTAECVADVHAYWDPIVQDLWEQGEDHVANSRLSRDVSPALAECRNFDNVRIIKVIYEPQSRLDAILQRVKSGQPFTEQDKLTLQEDYPGVLEFPENEYRTRYLNTAEELFRMVGGRDKVLTDDGEDAEAPPLGS